MIFKRPGLVLATNGSGLQGDSYTQLSCDVSMQYVSRLPLTALLWVKNFLFYSRVSFVLGFDADNFVFKYHHFSMLQFLEGHLVLNLRPQAARDIAWSTMPDMLASTSVVILGRNIAGDYVENTAIVFGLPTNRPFGVSPPPCECGTSVVNWKVRKSEGSAPRFHCAACKVTTLRFRKPIWSKSVPERKEFYVLPFPLPPWSDVVCLKPGEQAKPTPAAPPSKKKKKVKGVPTTAD